MSRLLSTDDPPIVSMGLQLVHIITWQKFSFRRKMAVLLLVYYSFLTIYFTILSWRTISLLNCSPLRSISLEDNIFFYGNIDKNVLFKFIERIINGLILNVKFLILGIEWKNCQGFTVICKK